MTSYKFTIKTSSKVEFREITGEVEKLIRESGVRSGVCHVFVPHTTAGLVVNEHADASVVADVGARLAEIVPENGKYRHLEGNSPAHIKAALVGGAQTLFIDDGRLVLGTWQGLFFAEFDGPRSRSVLVKIIADRV
jgi:secondary thiamine-phosphate synthase enzyme